MGFTIVGFSESVDEGGAFTKINAVIDQTHKTSGTKLYVGKLNQLLGAVAFLGESGKEARLVSPSLRAVNPFYLAPVNKTLYGGLLKTFVTSVDFTNSVTTTDTILEELVARIDPENPIALVENEALECETLADPNAAEQHTVIVYLSDNALSPVKGKFYTINANVEVALTAGKWEFAEISFPDDLPISDYQVVGARAVIPTGVAFRFVPVGSAIRPGGLCVSDEGAPDLPLQRYGNAGEWFKFNAVQPPGVEVLGSEDVAKETYELYIDVIKV